MNDSPTLRTATAADIPLLQQIYYSTRTEELANVGWTPEQVEAFLLMQFTAQHRYYHEQFPDASYDLILRNGTPAGRLYVLRKSSEILIIDIALLPEHRNFGIGTWFLRKLISEADNANVPLRIHVEQMNPALRLYERLGFTKIDHQGIYYLMEYRPAGCPARASAGLVCAPRGHLHRGALSASSCLRPSAL